MKKLLCLLLCCLILPAMAQEMGAYQPLYQSPASLRSGQTVSVSVPEEEAKWIASLLAAQDDFSLGAGRTFLYLQQGLLIVEYTAQSAGDYCVISCRTQDEAGLSVFEFLLEQFTAAGEKTLSVLYRYDGRDWLPEFQPI